MKKTLLALAVLAAGSAQAGFEVYNKDGVTVNMGGDIEVVYLKGTEKDSELKQEIQDADLNFDVRYAVNDDLQFGGYWEFTDVAQTEGDAYVALYTNSMGSFKIGRTCAALDDAGIGSDYQYGIQSFFSNDSEFCGDEMIRYDIDTGKFYATAAVLQDKQGKGPIGTDGSYFDAKAGYRVADFDFTAFFGKADLQGTTTTDVEAVDAATGVVTTTRTTTKLDSDESLLGLEGRYAGIKDVELAAAYYTLDSDGTDVDTIALAATYTMDKLVLAAGYSTTDAATDRADYYINAGYGIAPSTTAYVEVAGTDLDDSEMAFAMGVKAAF